MTPTRCSRALSLLLPTLPALLGLAAPALAADLKAREGDWEAAFNAHDAQRVGALYAPNAEIVGVNAKGWFSERGVPAAQKAVAPYFSAFPDVRLASTRVFHKGDFVAIEWTSVGTNKGSLAGAPPTNKPAGIRGVSLLWFDKKDLIKRAITVFDEMTLAQQIGLAPGPARAVPAMPTAPATWIEAAGAADEAKLIAAAKATWPVTWSKHNHDAYDKVITDDALHVELAGPNEFKGRAACMAEFDMYAKAIPDMQVKIDEAWAFGDVAVLKFTFRGTMKGDLGPFKATNKPIVIHGVDVDDLRGGKMASAVTYSNGVELLTHLGVLPAKK